MSEWQPIRACKPATSQSDECRKAFDDWCKNNLDPKASDMARVFMWESFEGGWQASRAARAARDAELIGLLETEYNRSGTLGYKNGLWHAIAMIRNGGTK